MKLLHIVATPRGDASNTLPLANAFLGGLREKDPDLTVTTVDLYHHDLPAVAGANIEVKYTLMVGGSIDERHEESWSQIERLIADFMSSDLYLISCPMWNFGIPYALKYYIDCLVQPGYVFRYDENGVPVPLVLGKSLVCLTSRGGDYGPGSPLNAYDFQEPYLRAIFGFIGVTDVEFVNAQPMDISPSLREDAVKRAVDEARHLATSRTWGPLGGAAAPQPAAAPDLLGVGEA